jgi:hypothetical protein
MRNVVAEARDERNDRLDNREESRRPKSVREKMGEPSQPASFSFGVPPVMKICLGFNKNGMLVRKEYERDGCFNKLVRLPVLYCEYLHLRLHQLS